MQNHPNHCIKCSVTSCANHCAAEDYCSLNCICIGTHETDPAMNQCTDCRSFRNVNQSEQSKAVSKSEAETGFEKRGFYL